MAGTNSAFNATTFRSNISSAMQMGMPNTVADRVTFRWKATKTYTAEDAATHPYNWSATPTTTDQPADVQVNVGVQVLGQAPDEFLSMGEVNTQKIELILLDTDYAQVQGADFVLWGQKLFQIDYVAPPVALFDVDVFLAYASAVDL